MSKIFSHGSRGASDISAAPSTASNTSAAQPTQPGQPSASTPAGAGGVATATQQVDVAAILDGLAAEKPRKIGLETFYRRFDEAGRHGQQSKRAQTTCDRAALHRQSNRYCFYEHVVTQGSAKEAR